VVIAVVDSFTKACVINHIDNWIQLGWLKSIFIDEVRASEQQAERSKASSKRAASEQQASSKRAASEQDCCIRKKQWCIRSRRILLCFLYPDPEVQIYLGDPKND